jgi:glycosyltransferase involved in cell wall biosynthesis
MKIAIDCRMIDRSGIGTVIQNIVPRLLTAPHEFILLGHPELLAVYADYKTRIVPFPEPIYTAREQIRFPRRVLSEAGVLFCPHYNIPIISSPPILVLVHDLAHLVLPEFFNGIAKRIYAHLFFRLVARRAARIVTPSEFTRKEILARLNVAPEKVDVIPNGPGRAFSCSTDCSLDRLDKYGISRPYILSVGNIKPHKNLKTLLQAFVMVKETLDRGLGLVIAGRKFSAHESELCFPGWSEERLAAEKVVLTGLVEEEDMGSLYHNAALYVLPSLYEGFGLTPLEALRFGVLPLVADAASLPEVIDDPALRFDPMDPEELAQKITTFLLDPELSMRNLTEQKERMSRFSWDRAAQRYLGLLEEMGG